MLKEEENEKPSERAYTLSKLMNRRWVTRVSHLKNAICEFDCPFQSMLRYMTIYTEIKLILNSYIVFIYTAIREYYIY